MVPAGVIRGHRAAGFKPQVYRIVEHAQEIVRSTSLPVDPLGEPSAVSNALHRNWERTVAGAELAPSTVGFRDYIVVEFGPVPNSAKVTWQNQG
ncbi:hypothetical protein PMG11_03605 [Penicillium brasilianum]|uniref:Uncharacterized protein n=1 Tax=Penicillium brasilianum TaxID=104259 RepID=A0A0F7VG11_PENBI|nr:hypothetical protein PMG11_03605 [Penicillium brasilianum]